MNTKNVNVDYAGLADTPLGHLWLAASDGGLWALSFGIPQHEFLAQVQRRRPANMTHDPARLAPALAQLQAYLAGETAAIELPVDWRGMTDFQILVRQAVMAIPIGSTASYGQIAARIGRPAATRAVGRVNATNPLPLVIPCHRVVGSDGSLTGYGGTGGLRTKQWLLDLERATAGAH